MIQGGKKIYFDENFSQRMAGAQMQLWTIVSGKVYLEQSPFIEHKKSSIE
jgi:hypothetical protein